MNKFLWIILFVIIAAILVIVCWSMSIIKNLSISFPIIPPEKMTIELTGTPEIRILQIDGSLSLNIPTKFDARIEANIPSGIGVRGSLDVELPKDFTIDIKGLEKMFFPCPHCDGGFMVPTVIRLSPLGKATIEWQCTKCQKKLKP